MNKKEIKAKSEILFNTDYGTAYTYTYKGESFMKIVCSENSIFGLKSKIECVREIETLTNKDVKHIYTRDHGFKMPIEFMNN